MARNFFTFILCVTMGVLLGRGYYDSFRTGTLTIKGRTSNRLLKISSGKYPKGE
jgi:hypothetical protein